MDRSDVEPIRLGHVEEPRRLCQYRLGRCLVVDLELDGNSLGAELDLDLGAASGRPSEPVGDQREGAVEVVVADRSSRTLQAGFGLDDGIDVRDLVEKQLRGGEATHLDEQRGRAQPQQSGVGAVRTRAATSR